MNTSKTLLLAAIVALSLMISGCLLMPIPAKTRTEGAHGPATIDKKQLRPGISSQAEVEREVEPILVPIKAEKMRWARFSRSSMTWLWAVGGYGAAEGGSQRQWGMHNLFATFDKDGTLVSLREVDEGGLNAFLRECTRKGEIELPPPNEDPTVPMEVKVRHRHAGQLPKDAGVTLRLSSELVSIEEPIDDHHTFRIKPSMLESLTYAGSMKQDPEPYAGAVLESLRFKDDKGKSRRWSIYVEPADLPVLLHYFDTVVESSRKKTTTIIK